ncbi:MAG: universal stress protein [Acidimicrobiia bacterium]|nr:universal stress protein [Acidimicrobiia bacterium]
MTEPSAETPIHVIVATDGTDASLLAVHEAAHLVPADAELSLVIVVDEFHDPQEDAGGFEGPVETYEQAEADYREAIVAAEGALARSAQAFGPRPIRQQIVERSGSIGARLCALAEEQDAAMLVVGSHGHRAIVDVLLGSVSSYVAHHSPCPVLVIRGHQSDD